MRLVAFIILGISLLNGLSYATDNSSVSISRSISIKPCNKNDICKIEDVYEVSDDKIEIPLNNFYKGGVRGSHGENKLTYMKDNIAFTSEVYINQIGQQYSVYTVLRVGEKKSTSVTKKIVIKDFSNFKAINLMKRIVVGNKVYNVILTIGPEIP